MVKTAIIILAAGNSSRLGQSKQLLEIDGTPMLYRAVREAVVSKTDHVEVVLGHEYARHAALIDDFFNICVVRNEGWQRGMGNSLKVGLTKVLERYPAVEQVITSVCDQPELTSKVYNKLITASAEKETEIVTSRYSETSFGVPTVFHKSMFDAIFSIEDEHGAKSVVKQHLEKTTFVEFPSGELDIDTPKDYQKYMKDKGELDIV